MLSLFIGAVTLSMSESMEAKNVAIEIRRKKIGQEKAEKREEHVLAA